MFNNKFEYMVYKLVQCIIFDSKEDYSDYFDVYEFNIMISLKNILSMYVKNGYLDKNAKENVYKFLTKAREYKDDNYEERIKIINEIISIINSQQNNFSENFYRLELQKRRNSYKYLYNFWNEVIQDEINNQREQVNDSIAFDLYVLEAFMEDLSDEEFIKDYLPDLEENIYFYESLNVMLEEYPQIFKELTAYNRAICILNKNTYDSGNKKVYKENKRIVNKIKSKIKKV